MRIRDWSSDVFSSDLDRRRRLARVLHLRARAVLPRRQQPPGQRFPGEQRLLEAPQRPDWRVPPGPPLRPLPRLRMVGQHRRRRRPQRLLPRRRAADPPLPPRAPADRPPFPHPPPPPTTPPPTLPRPPTPPPP